MQLPRTPDPEEIDFELDVSSSAETIDDRSSVDPLNLSDDSGRWDPPRVGMFSLIAAFAAGAAVVLLIVAALR